MVGEGGSLIDDENGCGFPSLNIPLIMTGISVNYAGSGHSADLVDILQIVAEPAIYWKPEFKCGLPGQRK